MFDGKHRVLSNVRYVPELKRNLISLGSLSALGYKFNTYQGFILVTKAGNKVMKWKKTNDLYILIGETVTVNADVVMTKSDIILWH